MTEQIKPLEEQENLKSNGVNGTLPFGLVTADIKPMQPVSDERMAEVVASTRAMIDNSPKAIDTSDPVDSSDLAVCTAIAAKTLLDESKENARLDTLGIGPASGMRTVAIDVESNAGSSGWSADQAYWDAWDRKTQRKLNQVHEMSRKHWKKLENKFLREAKKNDGMLKTRKLSKWYVGYMKKISRTTGYLKLGDPKPHSIIDNPYLRDAFYAGLSDEVITSNQPTRAIYGEKVQAMIDDIAKTRIGGCEVKVIPQTEEEKAQGFSWGLKVEMKVPYTSELAATGLFDTKPECSIRSEDKNE